MTHITCKGNQKHSPLNLVLVVSLPFLYRGDGLDEEEDERVHHQKKREHFGTCIVQENNL